MATWHAGREAAGATSFLVARPAALGVSSHRSALDAAMLAAGVRDAPLCLDTVCSLGADGPPRRESEAPS